MGSSLSTQLTGFSLANDVTISLGFKSTENQGLILQDKQQVSFYIFFTPNVVSMTSELCETTPFFPPRLMGLILHWKMAT